MLARALTDTLQRHRSRPTMDGNALFDTLKVKLVHGCDFANRDEAQHAIFGYIEVFYNRQRGHSYLGYRSPEEFERIVSPTA